MLTQNLVYNGRLRDCYLHTCKFQLTLVSKIGREEQNRCMVFCDVRMCLANTIALRLLARNFGRRLNVWWAMSAVYNAKRNVFSNW